MKKAILIALFLICVSLSGFAQTSQTGRVFPVRQFGAKCDGVTNDQTAIAAAITAATATGGIVDLPEGACLVTGLTVPGGVELRGKGKFITVIKSSANATILNLVTGSGTFAFRGPTIRQLTVEGSSAGANQIGINIDDPVYFLDVVVEDVSVTLTGSHGLYFGKVFSSLFNNITSGASATGYPFLFNQVNMPGNTFRNLYAADVNATAFAGFRIRSGNITCWGCNGINNSSSNSWWAIVGDKTGTDGATSNRSAYFTCNDCNIESSKAGGILHYYNSTSELGGRTEFTADASGSGAYIPLKYEIDTTGGLIPAIFPKGKLGPLVVFTNSPLSFYADSEVIHANDLPPVTIEGDVRQADGVIITSYRNTTTNRSDKIYRDDARKPVQAVAATANYTQPGATNYEVSCSSCTLTLPSAALWVSNEQLIYIRNIGAGTVTVNANSSSTMNGAASYSLAAGESVMFIPHSASADYRLVGLGGAGAANRIPFFDATQHLTSSANVTYDGTTFLNQRAGGNPFFAANDTTNGITTRFGPLAGAPDRAIVGTTSNHPFGLWANNAEKWTVGTAGHFTPAATASYDLGSTSLLLRSGYFNTSVVLGNPAATTGQTVFNNSTNSNTTTLQAGAPSSSITFTLPNSLPASAGCLQVNSAGVISQTGSACGSGGGGSTVWSDLTDPAANLSLSMGANTTSFTWNNATSTANLFQLADSASNTGTGYVFSLNTASGSAAKPARITAGGVVNGVEMTTAGVLTAIGTGSITANTGDSATSFFTSGQIEAARGGTGQDTSAATGMPLITGGTWSVISTTGTGSAVRATSPTLVTPVLGAATATSINGLTITSSTGTLTIANGKTATVSNTLTFNGTDGTSVAFGAGGTVAYVGLANSWSAGIKQTFAPNGTTAGLNVGSVAGDPSTPANGDLWYDSTANELTARINGANVALGSGGASGANPTATIGLTTVNGVATTFMRSDAAPALSQAIAPTWTGLHTYNPGTTPSDVLLFDIAAIGSAGTRDSHNFVMRGRSDNGSAHTVEWKQFIDVTSNAGASQWVLQSNLDGGSFSNWLTVKDDGEVLLGNITGSSATFGANVAADTLSATTSLTVTGTSTMREIDPEADNTYDLGTTSLRWKTVHVGPGSLVVHNDSTNTLKATLGFSGSTAQLTTDSATPLQLRTGSNNGLFLNTNGTVGFNLTSATNGNVDLRQIANGDQILNLRRATDTSPTGNFINFENAAGTDLFTVDITGSLTAGTVPVARLSGTLPASNFPALTGDVTTTAGSVAATIANDAVTYAKMQNVSAASKLLGRGDSGSGDVQEITIGSGLAMTGTTLSATGGGSGNVTTAGGTSGRYTKFTSGVNIENALLSESGSDISGTATLTLTNHSTSSRLLVAKSIASQSADMFALFSTSDANPRVAVDSSFRLQFGPGGATSVDTNLYRSAAATLRTDGGFVAGTSGTFVIASNGNITSIRGVATNFPASNSAGVLTNDGSGNFSWVASSSPFTASAGIIDFTTSTDRLRLVAGSTSTTPLEVDGVPSQTANLIQVKATSGAANPILAVDSSGRLQFGAGGGTAVDTNLYRNSANVLKTDDSFTAAGGLTSENNIGVTGTALRFTADFSNATLTNRFMFQSNTTNGSTFVSTLPNGSDTFSGFVSYNSSSPTSAHYVRMFMNSTTSALIDSGKNGGGAVAPLGFAHNAAQIATFTTGGHFTVGAAGTTDAAFLTVAGGISTATTTVSANTTLNDTHSSILCNASGAVRTMTLPAASGLTGRAYTIKKTDSSANACIIDANASETIDGSLTISLTGQYDSVTIQTDGTNWFRVGQQLAAAEAGYISGLVLEWVSTTQVRVTSGSAQLQSTGQMLVAPSSLTISPTLAANTWYHCYVFESSGVAALECVTTAPASAWVGTARSKTSDTARRYVGSIRTNASSQIFNFLVEGAGDLQIVRWRNDVTNDNRILTNGSATTNTNVDASSRAPVTSRAIEVTIYNLATGGVVYFDTSDAGSAGTGLDPDSAIGLFALNPNAINTTYLPLNTSQVFRYSYNGSPTGSNFTYIDLLSFRIGR